MRREVATDLSDSAYDFLRVVWPAIKDRLQGGEIKPVETIASDDFRHDLDVLGGIDAWQVLNHKGTMRGLASRIQWGDKSWRTFTIRTGRPSGQRTELEKRLLAIDDPDAGWLMPALTIQAYVREPRRTGDLIEVGMVHTRRLYEYARANPCAKPRRNPADGVTFDWYDWATLYRAGVPIRVAQPAAASRQSADWASLDAKPQREAVAPQQRTGGSR